jgi:hypothetical protein
MELYGISWGLSTTERANTMTIEKILADPSTSYWLRDALSSSLDRDPVDVQNDVEVLREVYANKVNAAGFKAFQSTRKKVRGKHESWECVVDAYTYLNTFKEGDYIDHALHINIMGDEANTPVDKYYVIIDRSELTSNILEKLERALFKFVVDEGFADKTGNALA